MWAAAGRWDAETSAVGAVLAAVFGRSAPANPYRPAVAKDTAAVRESDRRVRAALFEEGLRNIGRRSAALRSATDDSSRATSSASSPTR